jgi:hypothetical protein
MQMTKTMSRSILGVETIFLTVPVTLLTAFGLLTMLADLAAISTRPPNFSYGILMSLSALATVSIWVLSCSFAFGGTGSLRNRHKAWWYLSLVGTAIAVAGAVACLLTLALTEKGGQAVPPWYSLIESLRLFVLGVPLLVPLGHLAKEQRESTS